MSVSLQTLTAPYRNRNKTAVSDLLNKMRCKIFLIGMPGAGKTYWANILKKKLKIAAYDLDMLVEMMDENSVSEIFEKQGEEYFRKAESKMLRLFAEKKQFIVATGGGAPSFENNMEWMNAHGITIWIDEPVKVLAERLAGDQAQRPMLAGLDEKSMSAFLKDILEKRQPYYEAATVRINGDNLNEKNLIEIIQKYA